jgi:hypothetical protein
MLVVGWTLLLGLPARAQETGTESGLEFGVRINGRIDDGTPRAAYLFEALRGDVITIDLDIGGGDLDPVITLLSSSGSVLAMRDDGSGARDIRLESLRIPQSGRYFLIVGRFGYGLGTTRGDYNLSIERIGVSSASGSALRYGDSVYNSITDVTPQVYYSFQGKRGDIISVRMQRASGDLDSSLQVVNSSGRVIAENDDILGSGSLDAAIPGLVLEEDDTYIIIATRFGQAAGRSKGSFVLTLQSAAESGLGTSAEIAIPLRLGDSVEGEISNDRPVQYYRFEGRRDDVVTVRMNRPGGALDSFVALLNAGLQELASDDDSGGGQNALIQSFVLPADGIYYVLATRFQREDGVTTGRYQLELAYEGNAFEGAAPEILRLSYGSTMTGRLDAQTPQITYAFLGQQGDAITVSMNRTDGDLDARVAILDSQFREIASDDDSGGDQNARIDRYTLSETGVYYIQASRFSGADGNPNTSGSFILVLAQRFD